MEVHRCRFVDYQSSAINALSFTPSTTTSVLLACGRANGDIEIWNPMNEWSLEKIIPGRANISIETLAFTHQIILTDQNEYDTKEEKEIAKKRLLKAPPRLFSAGLNAYIIEWNMTTLKAERYVDSHGGAVWCIVPNYAQTVLAVGCEDGCIRLFNVADGQLSFIRSFDKQKGRILSLSWSHDDSFITSGSSDSSVQKWDVATGRLLARMMVDRARKEPTLVWCVVVLRDGTIVSGDSLGHVKFWDSKVGAMIQTFNAHGADVLCLAASADGHTVFTSGVDRKVNRFRPVDSQVLVDPNEILSRNAKNNTEIQAKKGPDTQHWVISGTKRSHSHDVRALALCEQRPIDTLVSGGLDVSLIVCPAHAFPDVNPRRLSCLPRHSVVSFVQSRRLIMARFERGIKIWRLGKAAPPTESFADMNAGTHLELVEPQRAVLEMTLKEGPNLTASAMSDDGKWIAVADVEEVKLFRVEDDPTNPDIIRVRKQKTFGSSFPNIQGAHLLAFTPGSIKLIVVTTSSQIAVVDLSHWSKGEFQVLRRFGQHSGVNETEDVVDGAKVGMDTVTGISVSSDGQWLATGDLARRIHVFNLDTLQHHTSLPRFSTAFTTLTFHQFQPSSLIVVLSSRELYIYDVDSKRFTDWSQKYSQNLPPKFLRLKDFVTGIAFNPARKNTLIVWGSTFMCSINLDKSIAARDNNPKTKRKRSQNSPQKEIAAIKSTQKEITAILEDDDDDDGSDEAEKDGNRIKGTKSKNFKMETKFKLIASANFAGPDSLVIVEIPLAKIIEKLPPSFYKPKYGT